MPSSFGFRGQPSHCGASRGCALFSLLFMIALLGVPASAQPYQVDDVKTSVDRSASALPQPLGVLDGLLYFFATDGRHGREVWSTDGTEAGTTMVRDIWPGPRPFTGFVNEPGYVAGSLLYFDTEDPFVGQEFWRTDGTAAGTFSVGDLFPGTDFVSTQEGVGYVSPLMLFAADDGINGESLWSTDGTVAGATMLADIFPGPDATFGEPGEVIAAGAVFSAFDGTAGSEPWVSDGSVGGTFRLADINAGSESGNPWYFTVFQGRVYFSAYSPASGREPWVTDGTVAGTQMLQDIASLSASSSPRDFTVVGSSLFFRASGELWKTDGTSLGTVQVVDLHGGTASNPSGLTNLQGSLIFAATTASGTELWKSDGTPGGTTQVLDIHPGAGSSSPEELTAVGNQVFFVADDGTNGRELWVTDGTAAGTYLVREIQAGAASSDPERLTAYDGKVYFTADDPVSGEELWSSDGTSAGTAIVSEVHQDAGSSPRDLLVRGDDIFFRAVDNSTKIGVFVSDGTSGGTRLVGGGQGDVGGLQQPKALVQVGSFVYFAGRRLGGGTEIYRADGTTAGTIRVSNMVGGALEGMVYTAGQLFFNLNKSGIGRELWVSDGTIAGTQLLLDIYPGSTGSNPLELTVLGSSVLFQAASPTAGRELWVSDGTAAGTTLVADLSPGTFGSQPENLFPALGKVFFSALTSAGAEPWVTDGTAAGTQMVKNIRPSGSSLGLSPDFTEAAGLLFFIADDGTHGAEVWVSDGTDAGTQLLVDVSPSDETPTPVLLGEFQNKLWFVAYDGTDSRLYSSDGTTAGTTAVVTLDAGAIAGTRRPGRVFDGLFYFTTFSDAGGIELWATDGTAAGTGPAGDIAAGAESAEPMELVATEGLLWFDAADRIEGRELWAVPSSDLIFFDDLESGDASGWDAETLLGGAVSYSASAADRGETGLEISLDAAGERAYLTDETPDGEDFYRVRFRFNPNSLTLAENKRFKIISSRADTGERLFQTLVRWRLAEGFTIRAKAHRNDLAWDGTSWYPLADDWSVLEIAWRRSSGPGAADGLLRLSIDGVLQEEVTGIDNDNWPTDWVQWGIVGGVEPGTDGSVFFDDFSSWRGPVP